MDPAQWLAEYEDSLARTASNAQVATESLRQVGASATSARGEVKVRVGSSGALEDLGLTPAARTLEAGELARLILATTREAQRAVGARVMEIMTDYVGDGPALELVKQNLLPAADPDDAPAAATVAVDNRDDDYYFANRPEIVQ